MKPTVNLYMHMATNVALYGTVSFTAVALKEILPFIAEMLETIPPVVMFKTSPSTSSTVFIVELFITYDWRSFFGVNGV